MEKMNKEFSKQLNAIKNKIISRIYDVLPQIGNKVCVRMYHDYDLTEIRYTYFEVDGDGYGRELFIDTVIFNPRDGSIGIMLYDSEDTYNPFWELDDMTTTDLNYLLEELEDIADFHESNPGKKVLTEYDADFDWENY
jgi:hypothetical protein